MASSTKESSLVELLQHAYSVEKNYEDKNFISMGAAREILTKDRINKWSQSHPLSLEYDREDYHRHIELVRGILTANTLFFVVLVFAKLEFLSKRLISSGSRDVTLFDSKWFDFLCKKAGLSADQRQGLCDCRKYVGVVFANDGCQDVPGDAVLPFPTRRSLEKHGSYGAIYLVEITGRHLPRYPDTNFVAEKRIRPDTNSSQEYQERLFREVQTLRKRNNHSNIIPLLAAYTKETDESGYQVRILHLLFPLAEMDLAEWMTKREIPSNVESLTRKERQNYIYRSIYGLASGIFYLHRQLDGTVITHHDLKPRNVLILNDELKIADFGHSSFHSINEESATEGAAGLGTYEYQPPEYFKQDGERAKIRHGRAFDVWALGCIMIELATLAVYDWKSEMTSEFRRKRASNSNMARKPHDLVNYQSDNSFHNNQTVVKEWLYRLKQDGGGELLNEILDVADGMLAPNPKNRTYIWEVTMDLRRTLEHHGKQIPGLEQDLCVPPPFTYRKLVDGYSSKLPQPSVQEYTETPLHRAAKKNDRRRTIRLWELGWPLMLPNPDRETALDLIATSDNIELRKLEEGVNIMLGYARTGDLEEMKKLLGNGLSPLMVNKHGRSALYEAIISYQTHMIELLLSGKAKAQITLWDQTSLEHPLHTAAKMGFVEALDLMLKHGPDVDIYRDGCSPLYYAAEARSLEAVEVLIKHKAKILSKEFRHLDSVPTPFDAAFRNGDPLQVYEIVKLLLEADDGHACIEHKGPWGETPILLAAKIGNIRCFELLREHGASIYAETLDQKNLLYMIAEHGQYELLQHCVEHISLEDFESGTHGMTPSRAAQKAQECGHKEVAKLLKNYKNQASRPKDSNSGFRAFFRSGRQNPERH